MPKIVIGTIDKGLRTDRLPFNIDNDSFPILENAYQWRGRIKRKRGNEFLGRLQRQLTGTGVSTLSPISLNVYTFLSITDVNAEIVPGSIQMTLGPETYTDGGQGTLFGVPSGHASINYVTGNMVITTAQGPGNPLTITIEYNPNLPVLGLEDFVITPGNVGTIGFDTTYSYNILNVIPPSQPNPDIYDVSFYKNPTGGYIGYTPKGTATRLTWNGQNYHQFGSVNYQGAMWVTNGIPNPFTSNNIGMQFKPITGVVITAAGPPATATLTIVAHGLVVGDFVFINEVNGITGINFQTGYVINPTIDANHVNVEFPNAVLGGAYTSGGIAQYLTNRSNTSIDCIRWYDGDPTSATGLGWVNFMPPLSQSIFGIADLPPAQYYLVGCRLIVPFKDRLLFMGVVVQTSANGASAIYLQDTIVYSQNGTAFYTASFSGDPASIATTFNPILVPVNQTATPGAYWSDSLGFGGFVTAGVDLPITTSGPNQDALIIGFDPSLETKLVYTSNDLLPFQFYSVNSELGTSATFGTVVMDAGVLNYGKRGFTIANQTTASRIDLPIPDEAFQISLINSGNFRLTAQRDFINEWVYFSYPAEEFSTYSFDGSSNVFNSQTLLFNYRDNSWSKFNESFTTYGQFRPSNGWTWATIGQRYPTWSVWNDPWNAGQSAPGQPQVLAGNQQGFVFIKSDGTEEAPSIYIQSISGNTVTSPFHTLNSGDFIIVSGCIGTIASSINGKIFSVGNATTNTFLLVGITLPSGTYLGGGVITRMYVPFVQSKQFPIAWDLGRKTRIGPMMFLLTSTSFGQMSLLVFLSQNSIGSPAQSNNLNNDALVYTTTLYTCPESTNIGLSAFNTNLQQANYPNQQQIWHRVNTSLIGDTVQIGFWLSDEQMMDTEFDNQFSEIEICGIVLDVNPSQMLA